MNLTPSNPTNNPVEKRDVSPADKAPVTNPLYPDTSVKVLIAEPDVQKAILQHVKVPEKVLLKKLRSSYTDDKTKTRTQKVEAMSGSSLSDAVTLNLVLVNTELDPVTAVNKWFRLMEYTLALEANMTGGRFGGYSATGFKLLVTKLEEADA